MSLSLERLGYIGLILAQKHSDCTWHVGNSSDQDGDAIVMIRAYHKASGYRAVSYSDPVLSEQATDAELLYVGECIYKEILAGLAERA